MLFLVLLFSFWGPLVSVTAAEPQKNAGPPLKTGLPKIKTLIVDGHSNHKWEITTPILRKILEASQRFTVAVATAPQDLGELPNFKPDFSAFDVVMLNYNSDGSVLRRPDRNWGEPTQRALEDFLKNGGALSVIHSANNSFSGWKEYQRMIGLGGWGHRNDKSGTYVYYQDDKLVRDNGPGVGGWHGPEHAFPVVIREPDHPITRGMPLKWMHARDELYSHLRGPAENLTVLATAYSSKKLRGRDRDEPMIMTLEYGRGRVFHTTLGHGDYSMRCAGFVTVVQRGTEWAATGRVTIPIPADFPTEDKDRESSIFAIPEGK